MARKTLTTSLGSRRERHDGGTVLNVHRWVRWWFYVGVVCGAVALADIFFRHLTRTQEDVILLLGVVHWCLGGLVCWAWDGIRLEKAIQEQKSEPETLAPGSEPKVLTDFMLGGAPRRTTSERLRLLTDYLKRWEQGHHAS